MRITYHDLLSDSQGISLAKLKVEYEGNPANQNKPRGLLDALDFSEVTSFSVVFFAWYFDIYSLILP